jgi:trehalose 6-phosphate phosphatase
MPRYLFSRWSDIASRVRKAGSVLVFLDFDGTLAPITPGPDQAALASATRRALDRLVRHAHVRVTIVSGRRRSDVITRVRLPRIKYWGLFGFEQHPGCSLPAEARLALRTARRQLDAALHDVDGVELEDKRFSLAVHVRRTHGAAKRRVRQRVRYCASVSGLQILPGREVWNLVPPEIRGKGDAIRRAIGHGRTALPIYVGDDQTDEPAFAAAAAGITVRVGDARGTRARYHVADPGDVTRFMEQLDGEL